MTTSEKIWKKNGKVYRFDWAKIWKTNRHF